MNEDRWADTVGRYYAALRAGDGESWSTVFAPDARVCNPADAAPLASAAARAELWTALTEPFREWDVHEDYLALLGDTGAVKWTAHAIAWTGRTVVADGIDVFDFDRSGRILLLRSYWAPAQVKDRLNRAPRPPAVGREGSS